MAEAGGGFGSLNPVDDSPFAGFPTSPGAPSQGASSSEVQEATKRPPSNSDPQDPPAALPTL